LNFPDNLIIFPFLFIQNFKNMKMKILLLFALTFLFTDCKSETPENKPAQESVSKDNDALITQLLIPKLRFWDSTIAPVILTPEQEKLLAASIDSPPAKALRNALNDYLAGIKASEYLDSNAIGKGESFSTGLSSFGKDYYKSKFLVLSFQQTPSGDLEVFLLPQSNPDRILVALMHNKGNDENEKYVLISFYNSNYTENEVHQARNKYIEYVKDPQYGF
jgi:hypothetical protein